LTSNNSEYGGVLLTKRHDRFKDWNTVLIEYGHIKFSEDCSNTHFGTDTNSLTFIADGSWHYISAVKNSSNYSLFVDGVLASSKLIDNNCTDWATLNMNFGFHGGWSVVGIDTYYQGLANGIQIWNKALTQSEIQSYMSSPPTGNEAGLVGYWNFNEGSGNTVTDLSDNGNNGTINGASWSTDAPNQYANNCTATDDVVVTVNPQDDATFAYSASSYCADPFDPNPTNPTPTISGTTGGVFSAISGLIINSSTGQIDLDASTPGTYTVTLGVIYVTV
jgi:hypothetical protein